MIMILYIHVHIHATEIYANLSRAFLPAGKFSRCHRVVDKREIYVCGHNSKWEMEGANPLGTRTMPCDPLATTSTEAAW